MQLDLGMRVEMKLAVLLPLLALAATAQTTGIETYGGTVRGSTQFWTDKRETAERTVEIPGHYYVVRYEYDGSSASVPLTMPPGKSHYQATIEVFEVVDGSKHQIGKAFPGQYVEGGCFEDKPEMLIKNALKAANRLTPEIEAAFDERDRKAAFEAQPLYQQSEGVLTITPKGVRDLKAIVVDGKVVWGTLPERKPSANDITISLESGTANVVTWGKKP